MKNILVIYNALAGKERFKRKLKHIEVYLKDNNFTYDLRGILPAENAKEIIHNLALTYETFIIVGGDGTINSVVNGIMTIAENKRPRLLFLPFGTSNDYAKMVGMRKNIKKSLALLHTPNCHLVDVNKVNGNYFLYAAALGKFSNVSYAFSRKRQKRFGKFAYLLNAFSDLFKRFDFDVTINDVTYKHIFLILIVSGTRVGGFNIKNFTQNTTLDDNKVHIKLFKRYSFLSWLKVICFYFCRGFSFKRDVTLHGNNFIIKTSNSHTWNFDGEQRPSGDLHLTILPKSLCVYHNGKMYKEKT